MRLWHNYTLHERQVDDWTSHTNEDISNDNRMCTVSYAWNNWLVIITVTHGNIQDVDIICSVLVN